MRIGIDAREFDLGKMTGIGRYLVNFLEWVAKEKPEIEFYLYINQFSEVPVKSKNLTERVIPEGITFVWDQVMLPRRLKNDKIDVFFSPYYKAPLFSP